MKNPLDKISSTVYDAAGQVIATIDPLLNRTSTVYDIAGRTVSSINGVGNRTTTLYDGASRPQVTINGLGVRTTRVYDLLDRPIGLVDGNAQRTTFGYDAVGNKILELNPLLARLTSSYDALRRQTLRIDPRGVRVSTSYNPLGKPVGVRYPDGSRSTTTYDAVSNRILLEDNTGRYTRTYDPLNRTSVSQQPSGGRLSFSWDAVGQRRLMVDVSGGRTSYSHDAQGQLQTLINPQGEITSYTYDQAGQRVMTQLANETWQQTVYDAAGRIVRLNEYKTDPSVLSWSTLTVAQWAALTVDQWAVLPVNPLALTHQLTYAVDAANRRTARTDLTGDRTSWTYDDASQLTGESRTGAVSLSATWTYDPAGNRISQTRDGEVTSYTIDPANRVLRATTVSGATTYSYDAAGNQTAVEIPAGDITTTVWDAESRQQVEQPDGSRVTFTYNSDHWRVTREDAFATTNFLFDKNNLLAELDDASAVQVQYTNEPNEYGNVISQYRTTDDESSFYAYDAPGSTVHLTDAAMVVTDEYDYEAFGAALATTGTTENSIRYIGKLGYYLDQQLGTYHVRRRQYDQILARFKSEDPLRQEGGNDNLYEYAGNNPVNRTDATGMADDGFKDARDDRPAPISESTIQCHRPNPIGRLEIRVDIEVIELFEPEDLIPKALSSVVTDCPHAQVVHRKIEEPIDKEEFKASLQAFLRAKQKHSAEMAKELTMQMAFDELRRSNLRYLDQLRQRIEDSPPRRETTAEYELPSSVQKLVGSFMLFSLTGQIKLPRPSEIISSESLPARAVDTSLGVFNSFRRHITYPLGSSLDYWVLGLETEFKPIGPIFDNYEAYGYGDHVGGWGYALFNVYSLGSGVANLPKAINSARAAVTLSTSGGGQALRLLTSAGQLEQVTARLPSIRISVDLAQPLLASGGSLAISGEGLRHLAFSQGTPSGGNAPNSGTAPIRPEKGYTGSKKHGIDWTECPATAKSLNIPQGRWSQADLDFAAQQAKCLKPREAGWFKLPEGATSKIYMPDGSEITAEYIWIRNNGIGTFHGYPGIKPPGVPTLN